MDNQANRLGAPIKYCDIEFECLKTSNPNLSAGFDLYMSGPDVLTCSGKILEVIEKPNSYKIKGELFV